MVRGWKGVRIYYALSKISNEGGSACACIVGAMSNDDEIQLVVIISISYALCFVLNINNNILYKIIGVREPWKT